ncbi:MAG: DCC1-like thiol-disulfide oxidoreductase, partial [Thermoleophilaceae bacterium]|nr:DCC1-like thiol-disulfide oxidoreductase [Thermoleophilaceae bacterium]
CVAVVLRWDRKRRVRSVALKGPEADRLLEGIPQAGRLASWHLVDAGSAVWSGGAAFSELFRLLPGGAPLARLTDRFARPADSGYRWVADHRSLFGRAIPAGARRWADRVISESERGGR